MAGRSPIKASIRWAVFARDGFCCRYCGAQAGQEGVELAIDHALSVVEGGTNEIDNLITSCKRCNSGKSSRSLTTVPAPQEVIDRLEKQTANLNILAKSMAAAIEARKALQQQAINMKCEAYGVDRCTLVVGEEDGITRLVEEFGPDKVMEFLFSAASNRISQTQTLRYIRGCARKVRGGPA